MLYPFARGNRRFDADADAPAGNLLPDRGTLFALPVLLLAGLVVLQTATTSDADPVSLWLGSSWQRCPLRIAILSAPIFAAHVGDPSRGAFASGSNGSSRRTRVGRHRRDHVCFRLQRDWAGFVLVWYTLGIAISAGVGAIIGRASCAGSYPACCRFPLVPLCVCNAIHSIQVEYRARECASSRVGYDVAEHSQARWMFTFTNGADWR